MYSFIGGLVVLALSIRGLIAFAGDIKRMSRK